MKKLSKPTKLSLATTTLKLLSGEQLSTAQGGILYTRGECLSRFCEPPTNTCA